MIQCKWFNIYTKEFNNLLAEEAHPWLVHPRAKVGLRAFQISDLGKPNPIHAFPCFFRDFPDLETLIYWTSSIKKNWLNKHVFKYGNVTPPQIYATAAYLWTVELLEQDVDFFFGCFIFGIKFLLI